MSAVTLDVLRQRWVAAFRSTPFDPAAAAYRDAISKAPRLVVVGHHLATAGGYVALAAYALTRKEPRR